jgi:aldose sugar dehydrogenase
MKKVIFSFCILCLLQSCHKKINTPTIQPSITSVFNEADFSQTEVVSKQEIVWGMDWLPTGELLFTERKGTLKVFANNAVSEVAGFPTDVSKGSQSGAFDLKVHPNYSKNGWIYLAYAATGSPNTLLRVIRFKLNDNSITSVEKIMETSATNKWRGHYGTRLQFDSKGKLYIAVGEGGITSRGGVDSPNQNAQNTSELWGKVLRLNDNGTIPTDNPILPGQSKPTAVFSYGHRNPQGLIITEKDIIIDAEHGPKGGDEINIIQKGANYGWPHVSFGVNYDNVVISENPRKEGFTDPIHYYVPSIGTCGMVYLQGSLFKAWNGQILVGGLASKNISKVKLLPGGKAEAETIFENIGRVRNLKQGPDGALYVSLENPGRIVRIAPK